MLPQSDEDVARLKEAVADVRCWLDIKLRTGRYSFGFVLELAQHVMSRTYNVHTIYDEIGMLEGSDNRPSMTKPAAPFTRNGPMKGLWHKHHSQPRFIATNLRLEMARPGAVQEALSPFIGRYVDEVAGEIAHAMVIGTYERRARDHRMTGEWIIFERELSGNYYLTLGTHEGETDEDRRARVEAYRSVDLELAAQAAQRG
jgi:hypothetical protein